MKILFVWTGVTRCAGDCWRALARCPDVELQLVLHARHNADVERDILHDLNYRIVDEGETCPDLPKPDALFAVGWHSPVVRHYVLRSDWSDVRKIFCFDMPWRNSLRCVLARFVLWNYLRHFEAAYVPGKSGARYARWLGFRKIVPGFLSMDTDRFAAPVASARAGFLYVGRDAPEKRLDLLRKAYARYRDLGGRWSLDFHHDTPYSQLPEVYAAHRCLVLTSAHDPWPLVVLEALSAGCEVVVSDRCMNRLDLPVRVVPLGDVESLAREMLACERGSVVSSRPDLSFWSAKAWADRIRALAQGGQAC